MKRIACAILAAAMLLCAGCGGEASQLSSQEPEATPESSVESSMPESSAAESSTPESSAIESSAADPNTTDALAPAMAPEAIRPPQKLAIARIRASSTMPDEGGYHYSVGNLTDGLEATAWVEGVPGLGVDEQLEITLQNGTQTVQEIHILNGYWSDEYIFSKNGYVTKMRLEFSDGSSQTAKLTGDWQTIVLEKPVVTDFIRLTILEAVTGGVADTCISEIEVYGPPPAGTESPEDILG